jgi:hypothetical protein
MRPRVSGQYVDSDRKLSERLDIPLSAALLLLGEQLR